MGPLPSDELQAEDYIKMVPKWQEEFGPGAAWIEQPARKCHTKVSMAVLPPSNDNWHYTHEGTAHWGDKLHSIGQLTRSYQYRGPIVVLDTANGNISRPSIALAVQLFVNSAPFGLVVPADATIPGLGGSQERASGMALRQNLFTGTSPYGDGNLILSDAGVTDDHRNHT